MLILETPAAMRAWSDEQHRRGATVVLVPTMGALHEGHLVLIDAAASRGDLVVVSIFVNRLQFNRADDFDRYPRHMDRDVELCSDRGVTAIYAPTQEAMYPPGFETHVEPGPVAEPLEGAGRPGHFRGVATVVAKLFNAVRPDIAVFGRKDFQQLAVVSRMVADLDMGIEILGIDTIREPDGLAMSSRNQRLTPEQRHAAVVVPRALDLVDTALRSGTCVTAGGESALLAKLQRLAVKVIEAEPLARLEYFDVVDPTTLRAPSVPGGGLVAVTAVWFGEVRLIDNRLIR
jgi:pantoate--beta-alanine ligase